MQAFLVTRQIYAGAGKFAIEAEDKFVSHGFQIAQRSDFFSELQSVDTMQRRPIINTRDEPHANPQRFRRFHVIIGDANMSPFSTRLKVGTTALVLEALVNEPRRAYPKILEPLRALVNISRDGTFRWELNLPGSRQSTAVEVQYEYLRAVKELCNLDDPEAAALVSDWEAVLEDLSQDHMRCRDRLDWVAKLALIREFQESQNIAEDSQWLRSLDLEYSRIDRNEGLYYGLEQSGSVRSILNEDEVQMAMNTPPASTRAYIRGRCVQKFAEDVIAAQWDHITLRGSTGPIKISLLDLFAPQEIVHYARAVDAARTPDDLKELANVPR
jgi:proteasome accessory factor A